MQAPAGQIVFGPFCLDSETPRLLRDGVEIELRPQALYALRTLARNSGRCMDYEALIADAWHGISVSRHTVAVTIGEVKKILREYGSWITYHPRLGYRLDVPQSEELIRSGWHYWHRHTREGFDKAISCFQRAARESSSDSRAFEGLSRCYLMLGTFSMRPPVEMHAAFVDAHKRAVALSGMTPELRADRAQELHLFERRFAAAEVELLRAREESPRNAGILVRLAILYATSRRFDEALAAMEQAFASNSLWPILPSAEILIRCFRREFDLAVDCGKRAIDLHPYLSLGRSHYGQALELAGRFEEALVQYRLARMMSPDLPRLRAEEARCLARSGDDAGAQAILKELDQLSQTEYVDAYFLTLIHEALGNRETALECLERAAAENSPNLFMLDVDPRMDTLRSSARFMRLRDKLYKYADEPPAASQSRQVTSIRTETDSSQRHRAAS